MFLADRNIQSSPYMSWRPPAPSHSPESWTVAGIRANSQGGQKYSSSCGGSSANRAYLWKLNACGIQTNKEFLRVKHEETTPAANKTLIFGAMLQTNGN